MPLDRRQLLQAAGAGALAPAFVRHARAADVPRFELGVASGHPRVDGMVLWTRLTGQRLPERVEVAWELAGDASFKTILARGTETAEAAWAHSVHAEPGGLEPARHYWYRFEALGQRSPPGRTCTAPARDAPATLGVVIASCQRWDHGRFAAWGHVAADPPDLVLFLGDYLYEYPSIPGRVRSHEGGRLTSLDDYRRRHAQYKGDPQLQAAHAACPWLMVWDDHEVENDYAGLQSERLSAGFEAQRAAAYQAFWEHLPFTKSARPTGAHMRIVHRLDWGRLARIHLLDTRQYRDPQACAPAGRGGSSTVRRADCVGLVDPRRSLLGREQEQWLADGWDLQRPWNLLAQPTLMARNASGDPATADVRYWTDGWDGYTASRQRLLAGVADRKLGGMVVLGGDVHAHYVADLKPDFDDARSPIVASEFCGTSISSDGPSASRLEAALQHNPHLRYARSERGFVRLAVRESRLDAELMVLADVNDPGSALEAAARFVVEAGRPGAKRV